MWKNIIIDEEESNYEISDEGQVRRIDGFMIGIHHNPRTGYDHVSLYHHSKQHSIRVASLVAQAFLPPRPEGYVLDHRDRDRTNNSVSNLRWVSRSESNRNRGTIRKSVTRQYYRIPIIIRQQIQYLLARGVSQCQIMRVTGVHNTTISKFARGLL